jgi:hypothetical protein
MEANQKKNHLLYFDPLLLALASNYIFLTPKFFSLLGSFPLPHFHPKKFLLQNWFII